MRNLLKIALLLSFVMSNAQQKGGTTAHLLFQLGYVNLNGNYFKAGPEIYLVQTNSNLIDLSATVNMAYFKNKFIAVPELGIGYQFNSKKLSPYNEYIHATFYSARVNVSPWNLTPEAGISILGLMEASVGYSFEFSKHKYTTFNGIRFGLIIHIPMIAVFSSPGLN